LLKLLELLENFVKLSRFGLTLSLFNKICPI